jgi:hypothetical protein
MTISENGNVSNAANFGLMTIHVQSFGSTYTPHSTELQVPALLAKKEEIDHCMSDVTLAENAYKTAINNRIDLFKDLSNRAVRMKNAFIADKASAKEVKDMSSIVKKISGQRIKPIKTSEPERENTETKTDSQTPSTEEQEIKLHSVSQMSYESRIANFSKLVSYLGENERYSPNEADLSIVSVTNHVNALQKANDAVHTAYGPYYKARSVRDQLFFAPETGAHDIIQHVKSYVKSAYGTRSAEYKLISKIAIRKSGK